MKRILAAFFLLALACPGLAEEPRAERLVETKPLLDFTLTDQDGKSFNLAKDRKGRPVLLTFIFTRCPGACPYVVETCVATARKTGTKKDPQSKPLVVALSFDPEYDTPARLRAYAEERGITRKEATFLTGDPEAIAKVLKDYELGVGKNPDGTIFHSFETVVIARDGTIRVRHFGYNLDEKALLEDTQAAAAVSAASSGAPAKPAPKD